MMAQRINHRCATIPDPTPELFLDMAESGYIEMRDRCVLDGRVKDTMDIVPWDRTDMAMRERWEAVAKAMYARVALAGGASKTPI